MQVNGTKTEQVVVDVTATECFKAICKDIGIYNVLSPSRSIHWKHIKTHGKLTELQEIEDISYHGSPQYKPTGRKITDEKILDAYEHLYALNKIFNYL